MTRHLLPLLLAASTMLPLAAAQIPVIGHWRFDEVSGLTAMDSGPAMNHGLLNNFTNDPLQWVPGVHGNAIAFDGVDDHVELGAIGGLPFYDSLGPSFTVCMWINGIATEDDRVFSMGNSASNTPLFTIGTGNVSNSTVDKLRIFVRNDQNISDSVWSDTTVFDGTWHHVAYVETSGRGRLYVDGVLDTESFDRRFTANGPRSNRHGTYTFDRIALGAVLRPSTCCWLAFMLDSLQIYGCELTAADITSVMTGGSPGAQCHASVGELGPGCGPGPFELFAAGLPVLGGPPLLFAMRGGSPNANTSICLQLGDVFNLDLSLLGYPGCTLQTTLSTCLSSGALSPSGGSTSAYLVPMPNNLGLAGIQVNFQAVGFGAGTLDFSSAVVTILGI